MANPYGFYSYIQGTTFDSLNTIDFNYIVDIIQVQGAGSKALGIDISGGLVLDYFVMVQNTNITNGSIFNISFSGATVIWDVNFAATIAVIARYP